MERKAKEGSNPTFTASPRAPPTPAKMQTLPSVASLDEASVKVLRQLLRLYPSGTSTDNLSNLIGMKYAYGEIALEKLAETNLIKLLMASGIWTLTKIGRDYCEANSLEK